MVTNPGTGSPNKLLYIGNVIPPTQDFTIAVTPTAGSVNPGGSVTATVTTATTVGSPQTVALAASGLPAGATATLQPGVGHLRQLGDPDHRPPPAAPRPGTYAVTITGTGR